MARTTHDVLMGWVNGLFKLTTAGRQGASGGAGCVVGADEHGKQWEPGLVRTALHGL